jgi:hypothetical protein
MNQNKKHLLSRAMVELRHWTMVLVQTPTINLRSLPVLLKRVILLLIGAHFICEVSSIITEIWPVQSRREINWFISPQFEAKMPMNWWLKYLSDDVFNVVIFYCLGMIAKHVSNVLFLVCVVFLSYHIIDLIMYLWNFKTGHYFYFDLLYTAIIFIKLAVNGYKPETLARIKSLF